MKKVIVQIFFFIIFTTIHDAVAQNASRFNGVWVYQVTELGRKDTSCRKMPDNRLLDYPGIRGIMFDFAWKKIQPAAPTDSSSTFYLSGGFNWNWLDSILLEAAKRNLWIGILVWTGMDAPDWLYSSPYNIGTCKTTGENACQEKIVKTYPDYYNPTYLQFWKAMTDSVINHINAGPDSDGDDGIDLDYRPLIAFYQSCQGSTGDLEPQNGKPFDNQEGYCYIQEEEWFKDVVRPAWKFTDTIIQNNKASLPNIHLLVNNADANSFTSADLDSGVVFNSIDEFIEKDRLFSFSNDSLTNAWKKSNGKGHYYQLNYEVLFNNAFQSMNQQQAFAPGGSPILTRDECDIHNINIKNGTSSNNIFALGAYTLATGLDMWMMGYDVLFENDSIVDPLDISIADNYMKPAILKVTEFVNRHSIRHAPDAVYAFSALRDGLDAGNFVRFPKETFNDADSCVPTSAYKKINRNIPNNDSLNLNCGSRRTLALQTAMSSFGAQQNDAPAAQGKPIRQRNSALDVNDVGWYTMPGNYERFLYQIPIKNKLGTDSLNTSSQGYWSQYYTDTNLDDSNFNNQLFGRFARGFDVNNKKNALLFNLDDSYISTQPKCIQNGYSDSGYSGMIHITYSDANTGSFAIKYQAINQIGKKYIKRLGLVKCNNTFNWITKSFLIPCDAVFNNEGPYQSDFFIQNAGTQNVLFALVEFEKIFSKKTSVTSQILIDSIPLTVSPNPAGNFCSIKAPENKLIKEILLIDVINVPKKSITCHNNFIKFAVDDLANGVYMIHVSYTDGSYSNTKLLVQH